MNSRQSSQALLSYKLEASDGSQSTQVLLPYK